MTTDELSPAEMARAIELCERWGILLIHAAELARAIHDECRTDAR
jgi:hypothetical protein